MKRTIKAKHPVAVPASPAATYSDYVVSELSFHRPPRGPASLSAVLCLGTEDDDGTFTPVPAGSNVPGRKRRVNMQIFDLDAFVAANPEFGEVLDGVLSAIEQYAAGQDLI